MSSNLLDIISFPSSPIRATKLDTKSHNYFSKTKTNGALIELKQKYIEIKDIFLIEESIRKCYLIGERCFLEKFTLQINSPQDFKFSLKNAKIRVHQFYENEIPSEIVNVYKSLDIEMISNIKEINGRKIFNHYFLDLNGSACDTFIQIGHEEIIVKESNSETNKPAQKNSVVLKPAASGAMITAFSANNGKNGYIIVCEEEITMQSNGYIKVFQKTALVRGEVELLKKVVNAAEKNVHGNYTLPGRICVQEFKETEVPEKIAIKITNRRIDNYESSIKREEITYSSGYTKKGPEYTKDGDRIIRFQFYDSTSSESDILIKHDNELEILDWCEVNNIKLRKY